MNTKDLLRKEIESLLEAMEELNIGSDEYKAAVDSVAKLTDRLNEMEKVELQSSEQAKDESHKNTELDIKKQELELKKQQFAIDKQASIEDKVFKAQQVDVERKKLVVNIITTTLQLAVPTGLAIWGTYKTFKFEETGTITTTMGRGFINKLLPKK